MAWLWPISALADIMIKFGLYLWCYGGKYAEDCPWFEPDWVHFAAADVLANAV